MSYYGRHHFILQGMDTGGTVSKGDTGPNVWGEIQQIRTRWDDTGVADTGLTLQIGLYPSLPGPAKAGDPGGALDTGAGFLIYNADPNAAGGMLKAPRQPGHAPDGTDTGVDEYFPYVAAGDRLRAKATAGRTLDTGANLHVYVWWKG